MQIQVTYACPWKITMTMMSGSLSQGSVEYFFFQSWSLLDFLSIRFELYHDNNKIYWRKLGEKGKVWRHVLRYFCLNRSIYIQVITSHFQLIHFAFTKSRLLWCINGPINRRDKNKRREKGLASLYIHIYQLFARWKESF